MLVTYCLCPCPRLPGSLLSRTPEAGAGGTGRRGLSQAGAGTGRGCHLNHLDRKESFSSFLTFAGCEPLIAMQSLCFAWYNPSCLFLGCFCQNNVSNYHQNFKWEIGSPNNLQGDSERIITYTIKLWWHWKWIYRIFSHLHSWLKSSKFYKIV